MWWLNPTIPSPLDNDLRKTQEEISSSSGTLQKTSLKDDEFSQRRKNRRTQKLKTLGLYGIDSQLVSLYMEERNEKNVVRTISFILQGETDPETYKEVMTSRDSIIRVTP